MPYGAKRLGFPQAVEIRHLYATGLYTQKQLAVMFGVSQPLICKIINNLVHKAEVSFGGEADVKLGYKHGN